MTDIPTFYRETPRKCSARAARPFICCECGGEIKKGQLLMEIAGRWKGEVSTYRRHMQCHHLFNAMITSFRELHDRKDDEMPGIGELVEASQEEMREAGIEPDYWPERVPVTYDGLREHARDALTKEKADDN